MTGLEASRSGRPIREPVTIMVSSATSSSGSAAVCANADVPDMPIANAALLSAVFNSNFWFILTIRLPESIFISREWECAAIQRALPTIGRA
ncbi:MAG: hypothetical protein WA793_08010 [Sphingorhabdus sp.]